MERATPYHVPHSTQVAGYAAIHGGDDRYIGNVFLGGDADRGLRTDVDVRAREPATAPPATTATRRRSTEYLARVDEPPAGDHERFIGVKQPVYIRDNVYAGGAQPFEAEQEPLVLDGAASPSTSSRKATRSTCETQLPEAFDSARVGVVTGPTSSASASSTRTSRSATAARR